MEQDLILLLNSEGGQDKLTAAFQEAWDAFYL